MKVVRIFYSTEYNIITIRKYIDCYLGIRVGVTQRAELYKILGTLQTLGYSLFLQFVPPPKKIQYSSSCI